MEPSSSRFATALAAHQAGQLDQAARGYQSVLALEPWHADARHMQGVIALQNGQPETAAALIRQALHLAPGNPLAWINLATALGSSGRPAVDALHNAARLDPASAEAWLGLGNDGLATHQPARAVACYRRALSLAPHDGTIWLQQGIARAALGQWSAAEAAYRRAAPLGADPIAVLTHLAAVLRRQQRPQHAALCLRAALTLDPAAGDAVIAQAVTAPTWIQRAARLATTAAALNDLGTALAAAGHGADAAALFAQAIARQPDHADARANLGLSLLAQYRFREAANLFASALVQRPADPLLLINLGLARRSQGFRDAALTLLRRARRLDPTQPLARFADAVAVLPILCRDDAEIDAVRRDYRAALTELDRAWSDPDTAAAAAPAIGIIQPFYLPYHGRDDRALQEQYGRLICRIMAARYPQWCRPLDPPPRNPDGRLRIGLVSGWFCEHSVWKLPLGGWVAGLDRQRFQVTGYHTGPRHDARTAEAQARLDRFIAGTDFEAMAAQIAADQPHVLLYPEIGMDPVALRLATLRLAPVQCNSLGQPVTSGLPTQDWFLSSDLMEPAGAGAHYSERLLRLPHIAVYYEGPVVAPSPIDLSVFGVKPDDVKFLCAQSLFKFLPAYDGVFPAIAARLPQARFLFIESYGEAVTRAFRDRLERAFAAAGLHAADHVTILPQQPLPRYAGLNRQCDVFLDSIGWSGFNTTLESLAAALPVVTLPGPQMRARHSLAVLRMIGIDETIADDVDAYIAHAVALGHDRAIRAAVPARMQAQRHLVYRDGVTMAALNDFLAAAV
ncbi:MAG: tetratricopeptide repeat protein [Azospirillaceae bacterium]|nr:tetratricopeptide repeat protein [Azospirillaceae bacterium]